MCYSVTLYLPEDADLSVMEVIFERHRLRFAVNHIPSQTTPGKNEIELSVLNQGCDCSFVADAIHGVESAYEKSEQKKMELRQKNWSTAKLTRAQADQEKARERNGKDLTPAEFIVLISEVLEKTHYFGIYFIWHGDDENENKPFSKERIHIAELSPERMKAFASGIRYQIIR